MVTFLALTFGATVWAQDTPNDVRDLVGARAAGGETALKSRGYRFIKTSKSDDRAYSNWWKASNRTCLTVVTFDGRYDSIVSGPAFDCNQGSNSGGNTSRPPSWAVGTFYSSNIQGYTMTISSNGQISLLGPEGTKSGRWDRNTIYIGDDAYPATQARNGLRAYNQSTQSYTDYSRSGGNNGGNLGGNATNPPSWARGTFVSTNIPGYTMTISSNGQISLTGPDGTRNGSWNNNSIIIGNDSFPASESGDGFRAYNQNTNTFTYYSRSGNSGGWNGDRVNVDDLVGARARDGESQLKTRGFRNVDGFKTGNTSYTIWWRGRSSQCVQVATADGRYDSVTDIGSHPKCR